MVRYCLTESAQHPCQCSGLKGYAGMAGQNGRTSAMAQALPT